MKMQDLDEAVGRIVKGVNTTVDVGPGEIKKQAAKFGNTVDKDGKPPSMSKKVKGKSTNVLYNLGLAEGYKLQLERDKEMLVLHIKNTETGRRTEVRGKLGYESGNYDPNDDLHQLLDTIGKSANISELMNGEVVSINPKHPDADRAKAATDKAYSEQYTPMELALMEGGHSIEETIVEPKKLGTLFTTLEALDQPYPVRWSVKNDNEWYGHAKEDDFYNQIGIQIKDGNDSGRWTIRFSVGDKMDKTGEGDQFKIFATVKAAVQEWWKWASKNAQVDQITFSAEKIVDSSRSKLYHRFAQQFARAIGYEMSVVAGRATDIFYLKKPGLEENFADGKKFVEPNFSNEWEEAARYPEFVKIGKAAWIKLAKKGKAVTITSANGISNTDAADTNSFKSLDKDKQARALAQLKSGTVEMPIVAIYPDGYKELIGGNTRLTAMMARDGKATVWTFKVPDEVAELAENFADGKVKGKSRPGRVKRAGASCKGSVTDLRRKAKVGGERGRMYHWCANMKSGRKKS